MTDRDYDWKKIKKLRQLYLEAQGNLADYWQDDQLLSLYDQTLAQRIAWKWRAVLEACASLLPETLQKMPLCVDWGCGTGVATRSLLSHSKLSFEEVLLYDRSVRAMRFAEKQVRAEFPSQKLASLRPLSEISQPFVLLVSHVLSELPLPAQRELLDLARRASLVIWVEAGRGFESRALSRLREEIRLSKTVLAPCLHQERCGMLDPKQADNWCHFMAPIPQEVFRSAFWKKCSVELGFDLRRLPVSYLIAADPKRVTEPAQGQDKVRILAGSRSYKAFCRWTGCSAQGILEGEYLKRHSRSAYVALSESDLTTVLAREEILPSSDPSDSQ